MKKIFTLTLGLALTTVALMPTSAQAVDPVTNAELLARSGSYAIGAACTTSDPGTQTYKPLAQNGTTSSYGVNDNASIANGSGVRSDITRSSLGKGVVTVRNGQLATFAFSGTTRLEVANPANQTCGLGTWTGVGGRLRFTLTKPQWFSARTTTSAHAQIELDVSSDDAQTAGLIDSEAGGEASATWYLPVGTYSLESEVMLSTDLDPGDPGRKLTGSATAQVTLHDAGGAFGSTSGSGKKYVALGNQVACDSNALAARFGKRVKSAKFYVDGRKVRTVSKPKAGSTTAIPGVARTRASKVRVQLVVDPPGRRTKQTVAATRTYRACAPVR